MADGPLHLGIDLGGSKILAVVFDADFKPLARFKKRTKPEVGYLGVVDRIARTARRALADAGVDVEQITSVGIGSPGPIDRGQGLIRNAVNLGWTDAPLAKDLAKRLGCGSVALGNDVDLGVLGEVSVGGAAGAQSAFGLFMGTGLGGGLVLNGDLVHSRSGLAGEIGHVPIPGGTARCSCGQIGCLETVASKVGIHRVISEAVARGRQCMIDPTERLRSSMLTQAWVAGDQVVVDALTNAAKALTWAVAAVTMIVDPDVVVLGGGVLEDMGEALIPIMREEWAAYPYAGMVGEPDLRLATLGDDAVATGAAVAGAAH